MPLDEKSLQVLQEAMGQAGVRSPAPLTSTERAEAFNASPGDLAEFDCPICKNKGQIMRIDENGCIFLRDCECMRRRRSIRRIERSGLKDAVKRYTLKNFQTPERWQEAAKRMARDYITRREGWFVAAGHSGSGKSHLCTAICGELMTAGFDTRYVLWRDLTTKAKAVINDHVAYQEIVEPLKYTELLYIDDFLKTGKGQEPTTADINLAFEILNFRYNESTALTVLSTELTLDAIIDLDEALGSRIYERSKKHYLNLSDKPNWRLTH